MKDAIKTLKEGIEKKATITKTEAETLSKTLSNLPSNLPGGLSEDTNDTFNKLKTALDGTSPDAAQIKTLLQQFFDFLLGKSSINDKNPDIVYAITSGVIETTDIDPHLQNRLNLKENGAVLSSSDLKIYADKTLDALKKVGLELNAEDLIVTRTESGKAHIALSPKAYESYLTLGKATKTDINSALEAGFSAITSKDILRELDSRMGTAKNEIKNGPEYAKFLDTKLLKDPRISYKDFSGEVDKVEKLEAAKKSETDHIANNIKRVENQLQDFEEKYKQKTEKDLDREKTLKDLKGKKAALSPGEKYTYASEYEKYVDALDKLKTKKSDITEKYEQLIDTQIAYARSKVEVQENRSKLYGAHAEVNKAEAQLIKSIKAEATDETRRFTGWMTKDAASGINSVGREVEALRSSGMRSGKGFKDLENAISTLKGLSDIADGKNITERIDNALKTAKQTDVEKISNPDIQKNMTDLQKFANSAPTILKYGALDAAEATKSVLTISKDIKKLINADAKQVEAQKNLNQAYQDSSKLHEKARTTTGLDLVGDHGMMRKTGQILENVMNSVGDIGGTVGNRAWKDIKEELKTKQTDRLTKEEPKTLTKEQQELKASLEAAHKPTASEKIQSAASHLSSGASSLKQQAKEAVGSALSAVTRSSDTNTTNLSETNIANHSKEAAKEAAKSTGRDWGIKGMFGGNTSKIGTGSNHMSAKKREEVSTEISDL